MSTNQKIEKIRSRAVNILFGPHHVPRKTVCFTLMSRILGLFQRLVFMWYKGVEIYCPQGRNYKGGFPRSSNLEYKSQEQATGVFLVT